MLIWLLFLPLAFLLFGTAVFITHGVSPLGRSIALNNKTRISIYSIIALSMLAFVLPFTKILNGFSTAGFVVAMIIIGIVAILATECGYFLSKKNKWYRLLVFATAIIGTASIELALVMGYISYLRVS